MVQEGPKEKQGHLSHFPAAKRFQFSLLLTVEGAGRSTSSSQRLKRQRTEQRTGPGETEDGGTRGRQLRRDSGRPKGMGWSHRQRCQNGRRCVRSKMAEASEGVDPPRPSQTKGQRSAGEAPVGLSSFPNPSVKLFQ
ncbi:hypothetical protein CRG98_035903 [Punica granatum]|uniref:Uncharacterized protein n=1 Tax=Punica granatum TaxID=22663 RepID=A0A2I0II83_PUNGR|nr:hypothetical protein CRG98_035903 [Punica granatum]